MPRTVSNAESECRNVLLGQGFAVNVVPPGAIHCPSPSESGESTFEEA